MGRTNAKCDTSSSFSNAISERCCEGKNNCNKKKSCSRSSGSNECIVVKKCNPCGSNKCSEISCSEGEHASRLCCRYGDAVVKIESAMVFSAQGASAILAGNTLTHTDIFVQGNGFILRGGYIVCPAHLVIIPPSLLANANRFPFVTAGQPTPTGVYPSNITAASRIIVTVNNVNKNGISYAYEAELRGVDGSGDIAVLCINKDSPANATTPCIDEKCHPFLCFGKSCKEMCGDAVYGLGNPDGRGRFGPRGIVAGNVINVDYADDIGWAQPQLFVASFPVLWKSSGLPILNKHGKVVAMQTLSQIGEWFGGTGQTAPPTYNQGDNIVAGVAEHFMKRVVITLIQGNCGKNRDQVINVPDTGVPPYLSYRKGFLGFAWHVLTGMDLFTHTIQDPTFPTLSQQSMNLNTTGTAFTEGPCLKQPVGVRVDALVGGTSFPYIYLPGGASAGIFPTLPVSPLIGTLVQDDIITHLDKQPMGNDGVVSTNPCCTGPPASTLWNKVAGCRVNVTYRKLADNYRQVYTAPFTLVETPALYDYPYYKINEVPTLTTTGLIAPFPRFQLPHDLFKPAV